MTRLTHQDQEERTHQKTSCIVQSGLTTENTALRELHLEPSAKRGTDRTEALLSVYWLSQRLPLKRSFNRILNKSTLVNPIKSSRTWKEINQIIKLYPVQHIKINFAEYFIDSFKNIKVVSVRINSNKFYSKFSILCFCLLIL